MSEKVLFPVVKADEEEAAEEELVDPQVQLRVRAYRANRLVVFFSNQPTYFSIHDPEQNDLLG